VIAVVWTGPAELTAQVQRLWDDGRLLAAGVTGENFFPLRLRLRRPTTADLSERFDDVRAWIRTLEDSAKPQRGFGYELAWVEINNRHLGRNRVPSGVTVPSCMDALSLINANGAFARFERLVELTRAGAPALLPWLARKPLVALSNADDWPRILRVLDWFKNHPQSGLYLRQIDVSGVDTKFVEARKALLTELLDLVIPPDVLNPQATGERGFETRYGLRDKPALIRLRLLDPLLAVSGFTDLTATAAEVAAFAPRCQTAFITENEVNGLAFPAVQNALVIFGLGYALDLLANAAWLRDCDIRYWGDIDTHGFVMLDRLRAHFPHAQSILMDRDTLLAHRDSWSVEGAPHVGPLARLTTAEAALFDDLRFDRLGARVRLEQERIAFSRVQRVARAGSELRNT